LVLLSQQGNQQALEGLLKRHQGMVKAIARSFDVGAEEREDLLQEGMIGLWKAVQAFQQDRGAKFLTLARVTVRRQMISALPKVSSWPEMQAGKEKAPSGWVWREALLSGMTDLERAVFERRLAGNSYAAIAGELKIPLKRVDNALQRAKKKAQRKLGYEQGIGRGKNGRGGSRIGRLSGI
jgi:RNA polymerase sporulation-specific sigma factor